MSPRTKSDPLASPKLKGKGRMGRVIPFSEVSSYIDALHASGLAVHAILDTNILAALTYEV